ncbi:MAG: hypothetical protein WAL04_08375 [Acidimicrobiales bacterium]
MLEAPSGPRRLGRYRPLRRRARQRRARGGGANAEGACAGQPTAENEGQHGS